MRVSSPVLTKIVGVGLDLEPDGRGGDDVIVEPVLLAVGDCRFLRGKGDSDLGVGVAGSVPSRERVRPKRLLALEFKHPLAGPGISGLGGLAFLLEDAGDRHR